MILKLFLFLWFVNTIHSIENDNIILAQVFHRHGDRSIVKTYPTDPWGSPEFWPNGFGQLTELGKLQQFKLGNYFADRYSNLINISKYNPNEIFISSTDLDRNIQSALINSIGIYTKHNNSNKWNDLINWQPTSVHTTPLDMDYILYSGKFCLNFNKAYENYMSSESANEIYRSNVDVFTEISNKSGMNVSTIDDLFWFWDILHTEQIQKKTTTSMDK